MTFLDPFFGSAWLRASMMQWMVHNLDIHQSDPKPYKPRYVQEFEPRIILGMHCEG